MKKLDIVSIYCIDSTYYGTWIIFFILLLQNKSSHFQNLVRRLNVTAKPHNSFYNGARFHIPVHYFTGDSFMLNFSW